MATVGLCASLLMTHAADAQVFSVLRSFSGEDGGSPSAALVQGPDGNLYGTAQLGGQYDLGTVFGMTPAGPLTMLYDLRGPEGADVFAPLVLGPDGQLYGTTALGGPGGLDGQGAVFRISLDGVYTPVHLFSGDDGARPQSGLTQGSDGWLYGTTARGGDFGRGAVFAVSPQGEFRALHSFSGSDGDMPLDELALAPDGWFYGTTASGGAANAGTVFRISPAGEFVVLHAFRFDTLDGDSPRGGLLLGADGALYGTTEFGGDYGGGTIFRLLPGGSLTRLHSFSQHDGTNPLAGLILGRAGQLCGTTSSGGRFNSGTVFGIGSNGVMSVLHAFTGGVDGGSPVAPPLLARDGRLYGTTPLGGAYLQGTVYRITLPGPATASTRVLRHHRLTADRVRVDLPAAATALTLTIHIRRTPGLSLVGAHDSASGLVRESCRVGIRNIVCVFELQAGAELPAGRYDFGVHFVSTWLRRGVRGDSFHLSYTTGGSSYAQTGSL